MEAIHSKRCGYLCASEAAYESGDYWNRQQVDYLLANRDYLAREINQIPGLIVSLVNPPVINLGSRLTSAQWQFTLQSTDIDDLYGHDIQRCRK